MARQTLFSNTDTASTSVLSANEGKLAIVSNGKFTSQGAELLAKDAVNVTAKTLDLQAVKDASTSSNHFESSSFTVGAALSGNRKAKVYNDPDGLFGTGVYWMDQFLIDCEVRVKGQTLADRTFADYCKAIRTKDKAPSHGALRTYFAPPMTPRDVTAANIEDFLTIGLNADRAVPANREKACFSAFMGWLIRGGKVPGLQVNPCLRTSGVHRNPESKRELYITHEEYREVFAVAARSERLLMELTYRTLQRPESDIILWDSRVVVTEGGRRKLDFKQNKPGALHKIGVSPAMEELIPQRAGNVLKLRQPLVPTLKGKGATDMYYLAKRPISEIQQLLGHANQTTTEIYIKARWRETAEPNMVVIA